MSTNPHNLAPTLERDPVCGMNVNPATAKHVYDHGGKSYYFCCAPCVQKFKTDPAKYLSATAPSSGMVTLVAAKPTASSDHRHLATPAKPQAQAPVRAAAESPAYVCPMCPEVRENKPGACPSCGMALEPEVPVATTRIEYTCPMHPEIVRPAPGSSPICPI